MAVTIYDVAREAGVSTATVSKVLSGQRYVAEPTRARVLDAVRELNYVPNLAARGLAGSRTHVIGLVICYDPDFLFRDPHLLALLQGIDEIASEHDCLLLLSTARAAGDRDSAYDRLLGQQRLIDGAIVEGALNETSSSILCQRGYPLVAAGYSETIPSVHSDDYQGARAVTDHLLMLGHRRIGIVGGPDYDPLAMAARWRGVRDALLEAGIERDPGLECSGTFRAESGYVCAARLMALDTPPTAIFAFNDRMAFGIIRWLRDNGYSVPEDVSVAGFDDIPAAAAFAPPLTTVRQHSVELGRRAATQLFSMIERSNGVGDAGDRVEVALPTELVVRESTGPPSSG